MKSNLTDDQVWAEFNRMQQWAMGRGFGDQTSRDSFFNESRKEQQRFYSWMCRQVPDHLIGRYWSALSF